MSNDVIPESIHENDSEDTELNKTKFTNRKVKISIKNLDILLEKFLLGSRKGHNMPHSFFSPSPLLHQERGYL